MRPPSFFYQGDSRNVPVGYGTPTAVGCIECKYESTICISHDKYPIDWSVWQTEILREMLQRYHDSNHNCEDYGGT